MNRSRSTVLRLMLVAVVSMLSAWAHAASGACPTTITAPRFVFVTGELKDILIDDQCQKVYVTNATSNQVEVFSLATGQLLSPITVGSRPAGLDTSPDGTTLYVANSGGSNLSLVDVALGIETQKVTVTPNLVNDTPYSIGVAQSGKVLFTTTFAGSGFGGRMMQMDPVSKVVSQRTDFWLGGTNTEATRLRASSDRTVIGIVAGDISSGPVFKYTSAANTFSPEKDFNAFVGFIAAGPNGAAFLVNPGTYVLDSGLNLAGTVPGGGLGVAVAPSGTVGYRVATGGIDVLNLTQFTKTGTLAMGDTVANANAFSTVGIGTLAISRDGALLAVITDHGFSIVPAHATPPFAAFSAGLQLGAVAGTPGSFTLQGAFTLATDSNGINPVSQDVTIRIGTTSIPIAAGSFAGNGQQYFFRGTVGTVTLAVTLQALGAGQFVLFANGSGADLSCMSLPITIELTVGDDHGSVQLTQGSATFNSN